jgi:hypothetical protein
MSMRTGRNFRYAAGGHAVTAAMMGLAGAYYAGSAIFIAAAVLCIPALIALSFIRRDEIDYARARNAATGPHGHRLGRVRDLAKNHRLVLFGAALILFQLADASMLPLIGENLAVTARRRPRSGCGADHCAADRGRDPRAVGRLSFRRRRVAGRSS